MNKNIKASIITILVMVIIPFILGYITALPNDCVVNIYLVGLGAELLIFSLIGVSYTIFQYIKKK